MPTSNPTTIDAIGVDKLSGHVALSMYEERPWTDLPSRITDLKRKISTYMDFVRGGQINETPAYRGKPIEFDLYTQFPPPPPAIKIFQQLKSLLQEQNIKFRVFLGPNQSSPVEI